jgi:hypothetical protein
VLAEKTATVPQMMAYRPGEFFLRELPPLRAVLDAVHGLGLLVVGGYTDLDPAGRPGLGAHAHAEFGVPVIGVAKTAFVGGVVTGVWGIVDAELTKPGAQTSTSTPAPALTTPASALVTSSPPATAASTPPSTAAPTGTITGPHNGATNVDKTSSCACQAQPRTSRRDTASMCFCSSPATSATMPPPIRTIQPR